MTEEMVRQQQSAPPEVQAFLAGYDGQVQAVTLRLRELVLGTVPDAIEQVDLAARLLGYGFAHTYKDTICVIMPLKAAVNLGFPRGVDLPDPAGLLAGTGKRAHHVKVRTAAQTEGPALLALFQEALAQPRTR